MSSPFPGMDPWLESPRVWPDFHDAFAGEIRATLNRNLPAPYYAQLGVREELGIASDLHTRRIVPDVSLQRSDPTAPADNLATAVANGPRTDVSASVDLTVYVEPTDANFVEIRDPRTGHDVVTLIEILSRANKIPGHDRDSYVRKRNDIINSQSSLIEIDLLRDGPRDLYGSEVQYKLAELEEPVDYMALVQRAWRRETRVSYQFFPIPMTEPMPVIAIPLREHEPESTLDLQFAFQQTYDRGPYRRGAVDYNTPPEPALPDELQAWAKELLTRVG